jgi:predicted RecB family endonuclease
MIKKSADGLLVSFRLGAKDGLRPGMRLAVVNEDGFRVGTVEVVATTETESTALAVDGRQVKLGCLVQATAQG